LVAAAESGSLHDSAANSPPTVEEMMKYSPSLRRFAAGTIVPA
jgi:hypothetical protein